MSDYRIGGSGRPKNPLQRQDSPPETPKFRERGRLLDPASRTNPVLENFTQAGEKPYGSLQPADAESLLEIHHVDQSRSKPLGKAKRKPSREKKPGPGVRSRRTRSVADSGNSRLIKTVSFAHAPEEPRVSVHEKSSADREDSGTEQVYPTRGSRLIGDPKFRAAVTKKWSRRAEEKELKKQAYENLSTAGQIEADLIKMGASVLEAIVTGSLQKETAKGNAYTAQGLATDARAGGLVATQIPGSGAGASEAYGIGGIAAAATSLADVYFKTAAFIKYKKTLKKLTKDLSGAERELQKLSLQKAALNGDHHAAQSLLVYDKDDDAAFGVRQKKAAKAAEAPPVRAKRERDPSLPLAQQKAALDAEIAAATKARNAAAAALKSHTSTLFKEWGKFLRDILAQSATAAASTAWSLNTLSHVFDLLLQVSIHTAALLPVMGGLNILAGSVDQYDARKDDNAAQAAFKSKVMPGVLSSTEALGHYERELHERPPGGAGQGVALQNRNAAEIVVRNRNRQLRLQVRSLNTALARKWKGKMYQAGGTAITAGAPLGLAGAAPGLIVVSLAGSVWWGGVIAPNVGFRVAAKRRAKARQLAAADYIAQNGIVEARKLMQGSGVTLGKKGNVVRQALTLASGGKIRALRDAQPVAEHNLHLNEYLMVEVYAHDLLAGPGTASHENAKSFLLKQLQRAELTEKQIEAAFDVPMGLIDSAVKNDEKAGTYVQAGHLELLRKLVATMTGVTLYDPASLTNGAQVYKAEALFGNQFLHRFDIPMYGADKPGFKAKVTHAAGQAASGVDSIKDTVLGRENLSAKSFLQLEGEHKRAALGRRDVTPDDFTEAEISHVADSFKRMGFTMDDIEEGLVYAAERCPDRNQDVFYAQPEVQMLIRVIAMRHRDEIDQSAFKAFAEAERVKSHGGKLPKMHRAITDAALSIDKFNHDRKHGGLAHSLDCINVYCDLASAGITLEDVKEVKLSLEMAEGRNTKKLAARESLLKACNVIENFHLLSGASALKSGLRAPWIILARVERAVHKELGGRRIVDGEKESVIPGQRARKRLSRQFFKQEPTARLNSFATENRWNAVRNHLAQDGIAPDDLLLAIGPLQEILKAEPLGSIEYDAANELLGHLLTTICPPVFGKDIVKITGVIAEVSHAMEGLTLESIATFPSTSPVIDELVSRLAEEGIGPEQLLNILKSQDAQSEASRMPPTLYKILVTLLGAGQARENKGKFTALQRDGFFFAKELQSITVAKALIKLGEDALFERVREAMIEAGGDLSKKDRLAIKNGAALKDICLGYNGGNTKLSPKLEEFLESGIVHAARKFLIIDREYAGAGGLPDPDWKPAVYEKAKIQFAASVDLIRGHFIDLAGLGLLDNVSDEALRTAWSELRASGVKEDDLWGIALSFLDRDTQQVASPLMQEVEDSDVAALLESAGPGKPSREREAEGSNTVLLRESAKPEVADPAIPNMEPEKTRAVRERSDSNRVRAQRIKSVNLGRSDFGRRSIAVPLDESSRSDFRRDSTAIPLDESVRSDSRRDSSAVPLKASTLKAGSGSSPATEDSDGSGSAERPDPETGTETWNDPDADRQRLSKAKRDMLASFNALWDKRPSVQEAHTLHLKMLGKQPVPDMPLTAQELVKIKSELPVVRAKVQATMAELYSGLNFRNKIRVGREEMTFGTKYDNRLAQALSSGTEFDRKLAWAAVVGKLMKIHKMTLEQIGAVFEDLANAERQDKDLSRRSGRKLHKKSDFGREAFTTLHKLHGLHTEKMGTSGPGEIKKLNQFLRLQEAIREGGTTVTEFNELPWKQTLDSKAVGVAHRVWASLAHGDPPMGVEDVEALVAWSVGQPSSQRFDRVYNAAVNLVNHPSSNVPAIPVSDYLVDLDVQLSALGANEEFLNKIQSFKDTIKIAVRHELMIREATPAMNPDLSSEKADAAFDAMLTDFAAEGIDAKNVGAGLDLLKDFAVTFPVEKSQKLFEVIAAARPALNELQLQLDHRKRDPRARSGSRASEFRRVKSSHQSRAIRASMSGASTTNESLRQPARTDAGAPASPAIPESYPVQPTGLEANIAISNDPQAIPALQ